jgi:predicted RNA methylase
MNSTLSHITQKLFSDILPTEELKVVLESYKALLLNSTSLELNNSSNKKDIHLDDGIAIGLTWAASCLDDSIRTLQFLKGTKRAIEAKLNEKRTVHLLYAGTGPFGTLAMPLLSHFSSDQLRVTLLDVNPSSVENVKSIIDQFQFQHHVSEIRCADATKTVFENAHEFDILLSETMQHALQRELQVVITSHLLNQMGPDAIVIPQSINLSLVNLPSDRSNKVQFIDNFMKVDGDFLRSNDIVSDWSFEKEVNVSKIDSRKGDLLAISTAIQVYEDIRIEWDESGLTTPKIIGALEDFQSTESVIRYVVSPEPGCVIRVRDAEIT